MSQRPRRHASELAAAIWAVLADKAMADAADVLLCPVAPGVCGTLPHLQREAAGKCSDGAAQFVEACGVGHVYRVPHLAAAAAAAEYEARVRGVPSSVVGLCERTGLPALDLVLLGSGADGHCASLYPGSAQV